MYSRRESEYISGGMLRVEVAGRRPGGRTERRFMDGVKDDKELVVVREGGRGGGREGAGAMEADDWLWRTTAIRKGRSGRSALRSSKLEKVKSNKIVVRKL